MVRRFFRTKDEMMTFALGMVMDRMGVTGHQGRV